ncbi:TATA-box-binding protein-associated factor, RNA polymerase i, subunit c-like [Plakobranchus ocellatus]|uniref:TATA-box-binding protein-associated factor, RNA polymerase i, subunit c-like n=1 Tax=Plakobranchus ocellatus TaxID=259542 RepID=A0AAV4BZ51_9GAST|nr:TATA-box-binding protein-associated factor, RNA polymerase i, subunit c-like [Plakobranchus ocellatus]
MNGNFDFGKGSQIEFFTQKGQQSIKGLSTTLPTIPLCDEPLESQWISRDRILGVSNFKDTVQKMKSAIHYLPLLRAKMQNASIFSENLNACINAAQTMDQSKKNFEESTIMFQEKLPSAVRMLNEKIQDIGQAYNSNCWSGYNRDYYGGLLAHTEMTNDSPEILVHMKGKTFNEICASRVSTDSTTGLKCLSVSSSLPVSNIFQLCASKKSGGKILVCGRESCGCCLFSLDETMTLHQKRSVDLKETVSSTCFSPYMENEILISSPAGSVYLWDIQSGFSPLPQKMGSKKMTFPEPWSTAFFGGHPRHIIVADNSTVVMFDHRSKFQQGAPLFVLPGNITKQDEQVMAACSIGFPYFSVASDYGLFLLDSRFPETPVMHWSTEMMSPPQYLQPWQTQEDINDGRKLLFLASQQPAEVMCFPVDINSARPLTAPILPWEVSKIGQFSSKLSSVESTLQKRFEFSLAGLAVSPPCMKGSFTVYQLDSCGDIFYQTFTPDNSADVLSIEDCSVTEKDNTLKHFKASSQVEEAAARARVEQWLSALESQNSAASLQASMLCGDESEARGTEIVIKDKTFLSKIFSCNLTAREQFEQEHAKQSIEKSIDPDQPHKNLRKFSSLLYNRCQTQLLLALKAGKDIKDLLEKREARYMRLRLEKRRDFLRQERRLRRKQKRAKPMDESHPDVHANANLESGLTRLTDEDYSHMPDYSHWSDIGGEAEETLPLIFPAPHSVTPSLFSSSSQSPPSLLSGHINIKEEVNDEVNVCDEESHTDDGSQHNLVAYHNLIHWLLQSRINSATSNTSAESRFQMLSSSESELYPVLNTGSIDRSQGLTLEDVIRNTNSNDPKNATDLASVCSSQRSQTMARPELKRVVDPSLSGFLSSPERAKVLASRCKRKK